MESLSPAPIRFRSSAAIRFRSRLQMDRRHLRFSRRTRSRRFRRDRRAHFQLLRAKKPTSLFPPPHRVHTVPSSRQRATRRPRNSRPIVLRRCGSKSICPSRRRSRGQATTWGLGTAARAIPPAQKARRVGGRDFPPQRQKQRRREGGAPRKLQAIISGRRCATA